MEQPIFRYDSRTQTLKVIKKIKLLNKNQEVVGQRTLTDEYQKAGAIEYLQTLKAQKNEFGQSLKILKKQLEDLKDLQVDEDFMKKLASVEKMKRKKEIEQGIKNTEQAIKEIKREILSHEGSGAPTK